MLPPASRWIVKSRSTAGSTLNCSNSDADNSTLWAVKGSGEVCGDAPYGDRLVSAAVAAARPGPSLDGPPGKPTKYAATAIRSPAATVAAPTRALFLSTLMTCRSCLAHSNRHPARREAGLEPDGVMARWLRHPAGRRMAAPATVPEPRGTAQTLGTARPSRRVEIPRVPV